MAVHTLDHSQGGPLLWPACAVPAGPAALAGLAGNAVLAARRLSVPAAPVPAARRPDAETGSPARPRSG
ncbi:hypothetical protein OG242_06155 [Streptomyces sp. NBC_00727]|uniref:hypothetical protein n=1 Tax=Streptomyces sp. NBC_00727 TaxID=2903675 RepID=UPI0038696CD6